MSFSILVLTYNEKINLQRQLPILSQLSDDIVVLDSGSDDGTQTLAKSFGCKVVHRDFDNERSQREFGNLIKFKYDWIYNPDADEIPSAGLVNEMMCVVKEGSDCSAFEVRFRNYLDGKWIKRSTDYPVWVIRFYRPESLSFHRNINLKYEVQGKVGRFESHFEHYPFSKGLHWWIDKHNYYSSAEAREAALVLKNKSLLGAIHGFFVANSRKNKRIALKEISFFIPGRGFLRFLYSYFLRMGFLDGKSGLKYCVLISIYEYMISIKINEKK